MDNVNGLPVYVKLSDLEMGDLPPVFVDSGGMPDSDLALTTSNDNFLPTSHFNPTTLIAGNIDVNKEIRTSAHHYSGDVALSAGDTGIKMGQATSDCRSDDVALNASGDSTPALDPDDVALIAGDTVVNKGQVISDCHSDDVALGAGENSTPQADSHSDDTALSAGVTVTKMAQVVSDCPSDVDDDDSDNDSNDDSDDDSDDDFDDDFDDDSEVPDDENPYVQLDNVKAIVMDEDVNSTERAHWDEDKELQLAVLVLKTKLFNSRNPRPFTEKKWRYLARSLGRDEDEWRQIRAESARLIARANEMLKDRPPLKLFPDKKVHHLRNENGVDDAPKETNKRRRRNPKKTNEQCE